MIEQLSGFMAGFGSGLALGFGLCRFVALRTAPPMDSTVYCRTLAGHDPGQGYLPTKQAGGNTVAVACPFLSGRKRCGLTHSRCAMLAGGWSLPNLSAKPKAP